jgi:hypothetical protein
MAAAAQPASVVLNNVLLKGVTATGLNVAVAVDPSTVHPEELGLELTRGELMIDRLSPNELMHHGTSREQPYSDDRYEEVYEQWPAGKPYHEDRDMSLKQATRLLNQLRKQERASFVEAVAAEMGFADKRRVTPERAFFVMNVAKLAASAPKSRLRGAEIPRDLAQMYRIQENMGETKMLLGAIDRLTNGKPLSEKEWNYFQLMWGPSLRPLKNLGPRFVR